MHGRFALLTLAATLLLAPAASAEPDFKGTLSGASPKFTWESSGSGAPDPASVAGEAAVRCTGAAFNCEYVLFKVEDAGQLSLKLESSDGVDGPSDPSGTFGESPLFSVQDLDGYLYASNAAGEPTGDPLTNGEDAGPDSPDDDCVSSYSSETCRVEVEPGYYVLEVEYYQALEAPYVGTAQLLGAAAPAPPAEQPQAKQPPASQPPASSPPTQPASQPQPQPQPQPQSAQQPATTRRSTTPSAAARRKACVAKAKKTKNKRKRAAALKRCKRIK